MKRLPIVICLFALSFCANAGGPPVDCSFDQAYIADKLRALAARVPGGVVNLKESSVSWHLNSGDIVDAGQGGCYDLGTGVSIRFANGRRPPTERAVRQLLAAISTYWSKRDADEIASTLAAKNFGTQVLENGDIELTTPKIPDSPFFQGFSIILSKSEISISWQPG